MAKYRKRPIVIEAIQYLGLEGHYTKVKNFFGQEDISHSSSPAYYNAITRELFITTLEGDMRVNVGDYIIKGISGEFYPCKEVIFDATYELEDE